MFLGKICLQSSKKREVYSYCDCHANVEMSITLQVHEIHTTLNTYMKYTAPTDKRVQI